jgi:hypothetical protein
MAWLSAEKQGGVGGACCPCNRSHRLLIGVSSVEHFVSGCGGSAGSLEKLLVTSCDFQIWRTLIVSFSSFESCPSTAYLFFVLPFLIEEN